MSRLKVARVMLSMKTAILKMAIPLLRFWVTANAPFKPLAYSLIAKFYLWRDGFDAIARSRFGFNVHACPSEFQEGRLLFFGFWEPSVTTQFIRILEPGDVCIDAGANLGYFTLLSSTLVGESGHVYAVEPSQYNRRRLEKNIALNGSANVSVLPYGLWDCKATSTLTTSELGSGTATIGKVSGAVAREETIDLVPLDDFAGFKWSGPNCLRNPQRDISKTKHPKRSELCRFGPL